MQSSASTRRSAVVGDPLKAEISEKQARSINFPLFIGRQRRGVVSEPIIN
jgi:hypothetical protein